jgi:hypothetical protein
MKNIWNRFWNFYDNHHTLTLGVTVFLFSLQILHLFWLFTNVIWFKAFGHSLYTAGPVLEKLLILVDFTEIPALISASLVYIDDLRMKFNYKSIIFLVFLNSQWLHLFWITDEFVVSEFTQKVLLPSWLAWLAILIDYLELPVIFDTLKKFISEIRKGQLKTALNVIKERD